MTQSHEIVLTLVGLLDEVVREEYEERAAIIEFDANLPRNHAECLALLDVLQHHPYALIGLTAFRITRNGVPQYVLTTDRDNTKQLLAINGLDPTPINLIDILRNPFKGKALLAPLD